MKIRRKLAALVTAAGLLCTLTLTASYALAAGGNPSADLDQCANDSAPSLATDGCNATSSQWVNGNLGPSKSTYREGDSIPYRMRFLNLSTTGATATNTLVIEWDTTKSGKHAIDYITTWDRTVGGSNPCLGVNGAFCDGLKASASAGAIPKDPQVDPGTPGGTGASGGQIAGSFYMWGGTITRVGFNPAPLYQYSNGTGFAGDKSARIAITFTATQANPVLAWGGHIATRLDWGQGLSAVTISGSPFHMRLVSLNGSGGNQDRSLSNDAVVFPGSITVKKHSESPDSTSFPFTTVGGLVPATFNLVDDQGATDPSQLLDDAAAGVGISTFGTYEVHETDIALWDLTGRSCTVTSGNGGTSANSGADGVSITIKEGENWTCTFTNTPTPAPSMTIDKTVTGVTGGTANAAGDVISYSIKVTNTGNVTLTGVVVSDPRITNLDCLPATGNQTSGLTINVGTFITCTGSYTLLQADLDNNGGGDGDIDNTATADSDQTGEVSDSEDVDLVRTPGMTIDKTVTGVTGGDGDAVADTAGDVIGYSILVSNTGNLTLTNVSVSDPRITNLDCLPATGNQTTGLTINVGGSITCTGSYTLTQTDLDNNGGGDGDIDNTAKADSDQTEEIQDSADVPLNSNGAMTIDKTVTGVTGGTANAAGDVISYSIKVTNTGNVTLTGVVVSDPRITNLDCLPATGNQTSGLTINVGTFITCTGSYTLLQADLDNNGGGDGDIDNTATADSDQTGEVSDSEDVDLVRTPGMTIDKTVTGVTGGDGDAVADTAGDVIGYSILVSNTGNLTLTNVSVSDPRITNLDCLPATGNQTTGLTINVGGSITCTGSYTLTQTDLDNNGGGDGDIDNTAKADSDQTEEIQDSADVPLVVSRALSILKTADQSTYDAVDDVLAYTIVVTNEGNTTLTNVTVSDPKVSDIDCDGSAGAPFNATIASIAVGTFATCTASHKVTQADLDAGSYYNNACADDGPGGAAQDCDDATVVAVPSPELEISKVDDYPDGQKFSNVGDIVSYTIVATNTGNVTLHDVLVADPKVTNLVCLPSNPVANLAPGGSINCTASHTITQADLDAKEFANTACVDDGVGGAIEACDTETTPGKNQPSIVTVDVFVPQDTITLSGLGGTLTGGNLHVLLRIGGTDCNSGTLAWEYTWLNVGNADYKTKDVLSQPQPAAISTNATVRWCSEYTGNADNAARPLSSRGEVSQITFDPVGITGFGAGILTMLAWQLWSRRRKENQS